MTVTLATRPAEAPASLAALIRTLRESPQDETARNALATAVGATPAAPLSRRRYPDWLRKTYARVTAPEEYEDDDPHFGHDPRDYDPPECPEILDPSPLWRECEILSSSRGWGWQWGVVHLGGLECFAVDLRVPYPWLESPHAGDLGAMCDRMACGHFVVEASQPIQWRGEDCLDSRVYILPPLCLPRGGWMVWSSDYDQSWRFFRPGEWRSVGDGWRCRRGGRNDFVSWFRYGGSSPCNFSGLYLRPSEVRNLFAWLSRVGYADRAVFGLLANRESITKEVTDEQAFLLADAIEDALRDCPGLCPKRFKLRRVCNAFSGQPRIDNDLEDYFIPFFRGGGFVVDWAGR